MAAVAGPCVAGEALCAGAGDGGDVADGVDFADDVVGGLGEVEIAGGSKTMAEGRMRGTVSAEI